MKNKIKNFFTRVKNKLNGTNQIEKEKVIFDQKISELQNAYEKMYKSLEHKIWEYNKNTNIILYEMYLEKKKRRKDFNPLVSIIVPVYNGSNYLKYALDSALNQTYKNIEIIVVNDGSNDDGKTKRVAKKYGSKIRYYEKTNGGVSSALNFGISKMKGDYFAWLSHDDLIEPEHIEKLVEYVSIKGNEKTIPFAAFKIIDEFGNLKVDETISAQIYCFDYKMSILKNEYSLLQGEINGGSVLIPKEAFKKYGLFDEKQRITQERDMWSRLIKGYHFISIPYDTAMIRQHSSQVTNTNKNIITESNKKMLQIVKAVPDKKIKELELNKASFYSVMKKYYTDNSNTYMAEEMDKLINIIKE